MPTHTRLEISVGLFVVLGLAALAYLSLTLGGLELAAPHYSVLARFSSVGDLKRGDQVKVAGVSVGEVETITLVDFVAQVRLSVLASVTLPSDTIASIQTSGLLGDAYVSLSPGGASDNLAPGGSIGRTEPAVSISELLGKYAFGTLDDSTEPSKEPKRAAPTEDLLQ